MAETIGSANVILGADTAALEAGLDAAKDKVQQQAEEIQKAADVTATMSDEERYLETLRQSHLEQLKERNAELVKTRELEEQARAAAANEARIAEEQALAEEQRYQNALLEKAIELENEKRAATSDTTSEIEGQNATPVEPLDIPPVPEEQGIVQWLRTAGKEAQQVKKLLGTIGKLAIFTAVTKQAYEFGVAIRENVIKMLKSAADSAAELRLTLDFKDPNESLAKTREQIDQLQEHIEAMTGSGPMARWARFIGSFKGENVEILQNKVQELRKDASRYNREVEGRKAQERMKAAAERLEQLNHENAMKTAQLTENPRLIALQEYKSEAEAIEKELAKTQDSQVRMSLAIKLGLLGDERDAKLKAIQEEEDAQIAADKRVADERRRSFENEASDLAAKREGREDEVRHTKEMAGLQQKLIEATTQEEADAIMRLMREKSLAFKQSREDEVVDAVNTRRDEETNLLSEREQLEERLNKRVQALREKARKAERSGNEDAAYEYEEAARLAGEDRIRQLAEFDQKVADEAAKKQKLAFDKQNQQIRQLKGNIDQLFNSGNMEVGVERVGSLIQTLIDKMESNR